MVSIELMLSQLSDLSDLFVRGVVSFGLLIESDRSEEGAHHLPSRVTHLERT